jgi:hypothetical protein
MITDEGKLPQAPPEIIGQTMAKTPEVVLKVITRGSKYQNHSLINTN